MIQDDHTIESERLNLQTLMVQARVAAGNAETEVVRLQGFGGTPNQVAEAKNRLVTAQAHLADAEAAYERFNEDHPPK